MSAAALLALTASVGYGASDYLAGVLSRTLPTVLIAFWSQVLGLLALGAAAGLSGQVFSVAGFAWGLGAGIAGAIGLLLFYRALEIGPTSVVAPVSAAGVLVPVGVAAVRGDAPGWVGLAGVPLTVLGLALVASVADGGTPTAADLARGRTAILLALLAAVGFGSFFVLLDEGTTAAPGAELWVVFGVLVSALPTTLAEAVRVMADLRLSAVLAPIAAVALLDLTGDAALTLATARGDLATVGVLASLDPAVTVLLAVVLLRERLPLRQAAGVAACLAGVVLVATG